MEVRPKTQFVKTEFMESTLESTMAPNNALLDLGRNIGEINKTLGHLQTLGVANLVTRKLPELVLVGDQSAGKSSLMSALAGLSLPRDSGTCTRLVCPPGLCHPCRLPATL